LLVFRRGASHLLQIPDIIITLLKEILNKETFREKAWKSYNGVEELDGRRPLASTVGCISQLDDGLSDPDPEREREGVPNQPFLELKLAGWFGLLAKTSVGSHGV
jgi:hypothetical protein